MLNADTPTIELLNSDEVSYVYLYEIFYDGNYREPKYWTSSNEDVTFNGKIYESFSLEHTEISQGSDGKINPVTLSVGNANRIMQYYINNYELVGNRVNIIQKFQDVDTVLKYTFVVGGIKATDSSVSMELSLGVDVLKISAPSRFLYSKSCSFKYRGSDTCKYSGSKTSCNKTIYDCRAHGNLENFGGFPALITNRVYI
ncbi:MAG: DUF2163 domain-containing protein [Deltaproteobacteria bacterium]|nr:DUF2163 domain-containing protein [Deltaproteobacteria bacterium]